MIRGLFTEARRRRATRIDSAHSQHPKYPYQAFPLLPLEDALEALKRGPRSSERVKPQGFTIILGTETSPVKHLVSQRRGSLDTQCEGHVERRGPASMIASSRSLRAPILAGEVAMNLGMNQRMTRPTRDLFTESRIEGEFSWQKFVS